ncbi:MAG: M48 family metallopeptidase [Undibacterium sp.]|nr:M48 family metallopeptidase [Opitutaceae bacterium]
MKRWIALVLIGGLMTLAGCYTNPVTGRRSLVLLSQGEEVALGQASFAELRQKQRAATDPIVNARVKRIGERIAQAVGNELPDAKWEFVVFEADDVNAFALPGGKVGVYTGLIKLVGSDDELAIVMGHEIGHVIARHGSERMSQGMVIAGVGALGTTAVEAKSDAQKAQLFQQAYGGLTTLALVLPHSRGNESEADRMGALYAARAGYDPRASITFWQKMSAQKGNAAAGGKWSVLMSTHPADAQRIADLEALMPQVVPVFEQNRGKFQ